MATITRIEDIETWRLARELSRKIWKVSCTENFAKDFGLKNQINKVAGSTMDNIAEGFGRGGNKEFIHFLTIAKASNEEVKSQIYRALDRSHIDEKIFNILFAEVNLINAKLITFINYLKTSNHKGNKFK